MSMQKKPPRALLPLGRARASLETPISVLASLIHNNAAFIAASMGLQESASLGCAGLGERASSCGPAGLGTSRGAGLRAGSCVLIQWPGRRRDACMVSPAQAEGGSARGQTQPCKDTAGCCLHHIYPHPVGRNKSHGVPVFNLLPLSSKFTLPYLLWDNGLGSLSVSPIREHSINSCQ